MEKFQDDTKYLEKVLNEEILLVKITQNQKLADSKYFPTYYQSFSDER